MSAQSHCCVCGRALSNPTSVAAGMGPICAAKERAKREKQEEWGDRFDLPWDAATGDIICHRDEHNRLHFNLPATVHDHGAGLEFGYGGSGPADFALSILALFLPPGSDGHPPVETHGGERVSATAWALHQDFKWAFIARLPEEGGTISGADIRAWIAAAQPSYDQLALLVA
jgi:hypothetical protein